MADERATNRPTRDELLARISTDKRVCGGMACIKGTRVMVAIVLDSLAAGMSEQEILEAYPSLTQGDVRASLAYAAELSREMVWRVAG